MLKQRVITALLLGLGVIFANFSFNDLAWSVLVAVVMVLAIHEWCKLVKIGSLGRFFLVAASILPIIYCSSVSRESLPDYPFFLAALYLISASFWLFSVPSFLYFRIEPVGWYWRYFSVVIMMLSAAIAMVELRRTDPWLLLAAILLVCIADISAYFSGRRFGKRKLAPKVSPGKTWEGVAGALIGVLLFCVMLWFSVPEFNQLISLPILVLFALCSVFLCVQGDLYESLLKREAGVKDSGSILPGHGGVLDRIDAMLAFFPCAGALLLFVQLSQ